MAGRRSDASAASAADLETITGTVRKIRGPFGDGWSILQVEPHGTVTGNLSDFQVGDKVSFQGKFKSHPKYGKQFEAKFATLDVPRDEDGMRGYLSLNFKWIGPILAEKMIRTFGEALFEIIEKEPARLAEVQGVTVERASEIHDRWLELRDDQREDVWFSKHGITLNMRNRLIQVYGTKAAVISKIKSNPYVLSRTRCGASVSKKPT